MAEKTSKKKKSSQAVKRPPVSSRQKPSSGSPAFHKQFLLLAFAVVLLLSYFSIGYTREWFKDKILTYWDEFRDQKDKMGFEERMTMRFGSTYTITKTVSDFLKTRGQGKKLLLAAPNDYLAQNKVQYKVPEPAIFYYYTGIKTVWANSEDAQKANWYLSAANGQLMIDSVMNKRQLDSVIKKFRTYKISL